MAYLIFKEDYILWASTSSDATIQSQIFYFCFVTPACNAVTFLL